MSRWTLNPQAPQCANSPAVAQVLVQTDSISSHDVTNLPEHAPPREKRKRFLHYVGISRFSKTRSQRRVPALLCALLLSGCFAPERYEATWGSAEIRVDTKEGILRVRSADRTWAELNLFRAGFAVGEAFYEMQYGMFRIDESGTQAPLRADEIRLLETPAEGPLRIGLFKDEKEIAELELRPEGPNHLLLRATAHDDRHNRTYLSMSCEAEDHFAGFGAHTHDVDFRGQIVPVWVSEQGVGKSDTNEYAPLWFVAGRRHTTHVAVPATVTSRGTALAIDTHAFTRFDVCASDESELVLESFEGEMRLHLFDGPTPLEAIESLTRFTGRPRMPPAWAFAPWNDAIFGTASVREMAQFLRSEEIPSSAIWTEDFRGGEWSGDLYRLEEDWRLDTELYPEFQSLIAELKGMGFAHQLYFNTFLTRGKDVFQEAADNGFAILEKQGNQPFLFDGADAQFSPTGLVDLTNPDAVRWTAGFLHDAIDWGALGWMADFAEWMPVEGVRLHSGADPALVHNLYPVLWAQLNDEVVRERGLENEMNIFHRSAHLYSQRYVQILWAGDQRTDFQRDDGMPTVIPMGLGAAAVGFPFFAHDIAGYQSSTNPVVSKELFFRWTSLGAYTPIMRTHHGTHATQNWNLRSDEESTDHFRTYAELHMQLFPYLYGLAALAIERGQPLWLSLGLVFPKDPSAWPILDQFFLGTHLLVAPVVEEGAQTREVYFPAGRYVPFMGAGSAVTGPATVQVRAAVDEIPVYLRAGGIVPLLREPVQTLLPGSFDVPGLEATNGDRAVYVALGADGEFAEESGSRYILEGSGTSLAGLELDETGAVHLRGDGVVEGSGFRFRLEGHPTSRDTWIYFQ